MARGAAPRRQGIYWLLTIPQESFVPWLPSGVAWLRCQLERGDGGYLHWQLVLALSKKGSLSTVRDIFGPVHAELSRSSAASEYVWKEETSVPGTRYELGSKPFNRSSVTDWDSVWRNASEGQLLQVPSDVRIRCYNQLRRIGGDFARPVAMVRSCVVYWGATGVGKTRRAWEEAGLEAYAKDPRTKWFCGYLGESNCVIDEFRGSIDIAHLLRWFDRYPVRVETKGSTLPLRVESFWVTSNLHPRDWYPQLDASTYDALMRRLSVFELT